MQLPGFSTALLMSAAILSVSALYWLLQRYLNSWWRYQIGFFARHPLLGRKTFIHIFALLAGFWCSLFSARLTADWELPRSLERHHLTVTGYIRSLPARKKDHVTFEFATETIAGVACHTILRLSWYGMSGDNAGDGNGDRADNNNDHPPQLRGGDKWQLVVRLKRPHGTINPGAFDYEQFLWQHKIRATGYVVNANPHNMRIVEPSPASRYFLLRLRQKIEDAINVALPNQTFAPMINALVLGDQSGITKAQWDLFRDTGTSYLMAIAGLHICWAAGVIFLLVNYLWRRSPRLVTLLPAREAAAIAGFIAALIYSALSGFSIPTQRALTMLGVFSASLLLRRHTSPWYAFCLALSVVLLLDPMAVLAPGFWLSFSAVALIFYVTAGRLQLPNVWWRKYWRMQWAITLGLAPFTLIFFAEASFTTFLSNIFALPAVCSFAVPLAIFGSLLLLLSPWCGKIILLLAVKLLGVVWLWLQSFAMLPELNWHQAVLNWWTGAGAIVGVLLLLAPRGFYGKGAGMLWVTPLLCYVPEQPRDDGEIWFSVLDVGQGLATVVQTAHHTLVYDAGPQFGESSAGESVVVPFVRMMGRSKVDALVVSDSGDAGSVVSAQAVMKALRVEKVIANAPERVGAGAEVSKGKGGRVVLERCVAGQMWRWDGVDFRVLFPVIDGGQQGAQIGEAGRVGQTEQVEQVEEKGCVLRVDNGKSAVLLMGDTGWEQEKYLLQHERAHLAASVLVAPRHGAPWSSLWALVRAVRAEYVVFAVGYKNTYSLPTKSVVARYVESGAKTLQTQSSGAITFKLKGRGDRAAALPDDGAQIKAVLLYRDLLHRYWHDG